MYDQFAETKAAIEQTIYFKRKLSFATIYFGFKF